MGWELTAFSVPFALVSAALLALAVALTRAARRETDTGAYIVVSLLVGTALWVFLYTLQVSQTGLTMSVFIGKLELAALAVLPPIWLAYVTWYTGHEQWLTPRTIGPIFGVGLLLVLGIATNEAHLLFWEQVWMLDSPVNALAAEYGPLHAVYVAYLYLTVAAATVLLVGTSIGTRGVLRAQSVSLLAFSLAPALAGVAYAMGYTIVPGLNLAALAMVVAALAGAVSLFRFRWLELQPITRDHVLSVLSEPTLVVDANGDVLDHNPRAAELFTGSRNGDVVGRQLAEIAPELETFHSTAGTPGSTETTLATADGRKQFEVTVTNKAGRGGVVLLLHDITGRVEAQSELADGHATMKDLVRVARDLSAATEAETVHERTVHAACSLIAADHCRLVDEEDWTTLAATGETTTFDDALSATIAKRVAEAGRSHVVDDLTIRGTTIDSGIDGTGAAVGPTDHDSSVTPDYPSDDGASINGASENRSAVDVVSGGAASINGASDDGAAVNGGLEDGAAVNGASDDGASVDAATVDGRAADFGFGNSDVSGDGNTPASGDNSQTGVGSDTNAAADAAASADASTSTAASAEPDAAPDPILEETFGSLASVPVEGVGVLQAFHRDVGEFSTNDVETLTLLSAHVTTANDRVATEEELRDERDRLEEFASVVSHDLRNPLSVATGFLELAREEPADEHFERIEAALEQMDDLIDDLLQLARHGETIGERETVDLQSIARDAWGMVETGDAMLRFGGDLGTVDVDKARAVELFSNLFRNSIEHGAEDGEVKVRVKRNGNRLSVVDDGPGIPVELREQVLNRGVSTSESGTGFGLAIVSKIADAHGWEITVGESESGGARFDISGIE